MWCECCASCIQEGCDRCCCCKVTLGNIPGDQVSAEEVNRLRQDAAAFREQAEHLSRRCGLVEQERDEARALAVALAYAYVDDHNRCGMPPFHAVSVISNYDHMLPKGWKEKVEQWSKRND